MANISTRVFALDDVVTDDAIRERLRPWRVVLDIVGDEGVRLTSAGWLPPAYVERICDEIGVQHTYGKATASNTLQRS